MTEPDVLRDLMRRNEIVIGEMATNMGLMAERLGDLGDQTQASTQAVLRVLDRLDEQDG